MLQFCVFLLVQMRNILCPNNTLALQRGDQRRMVRLVVTCCTHSDDGTASVNVPNPPDLYSTAPVETWLL